MAVPIGQWSFAKGELADTMYGRVDQAAYKVGAALLRNFFVDYHGGAASRPGSRFVARCRASEAIPDAGGQPRLIRFILSTSTAFELEFGHHYMRVHYLPPGGLPGPVLEPALAIIGFSGSTLTIPGNSYAQYDAIFVNGMKGATGLNGGVWQVASVSGSSVTIATLDGLPIGTAGAGTYVSGGTAGRLYTLATPYAAADLKLLKTTQADQTMTICHPGYAPANLVPSTPWSWTLSTIAFAAKVQPPTGLAATQTGTTGTIGWYYAYVVTAETDSPPEESITSDVVLVSDGTALNQSTGVMNTITWTPAATGNAPVRYRVYKANPTYGAAVPAGATFGFLGTTTGLSFTDLNLAADFAVTPPLHRNPFANAALATATVTASGSGYVQPEATITDATGTGGVIQLAAVSGALGAAVIVDPGQDYTAPTIVITDAGGSGSGGAVSVTVGPATGNNPGVVEYYQKRMVFAATVNAPETVWATQTANPTNMDRSEPTIDTDALEITLTSRQLNAVQHLIDVPAGLICFTTGGAWLIGGGGAGAAVQALTPANELAQPQASNGAAEVPSPLLIDYNILFPQARGSKVRDFKFNFYFNIYTGTEISMLASHLFDNHTITEWCWTEEPNKLVLAIRDDGVMLALTYVEEEEVKAWTHYDTQGFYRSVSSIPEGIEDAAYTIVERYINGQWLYYIERFEARLSGGDITRGIPGDVRQSWCVDSGINYPLTCPPAALTPSGLTAIAMEQGPATWGGAGTFTASAPITVAAGDVLEINNGVGTVTVGATAATTFQATMTQPMWSMLPAASGAWSCTTPVSTVGNLSHLEGMAVSILADGGVVAGQTVTNGTVTLPVPATRIVVGLGYVCQMKTLPIDAGDPTVQGRRKKVAPMTVRVKDTRGLQGGHNFGSIWEIKNPATYAVPIPLFTGDQRLVLDPLWELTGQVCLQQDYPLPAHILALIPEVEMGDTPA